MLRARLLVSAVLIPLLVLLFWVDHRAGAAAPVLLVLCLAVGARAAWETSALLRASGLEVSTVWPVLATAAVVASGWRYPQIRLQPDWPQALAAVLVAFTSVSVILLARAVATFRPGQPNVARLAGELFVVVYAGVLLAVTVQLRWMFGTQAGYLVLVSLVVAVKMGDTGAYTFGKLFGRRKLAPQLSPGKTWAGAVGAVVFGVGGAVAWLRWAPPAFDPTWPPVPWHWAAVYGAVLAVVGLVGDLCESLLKRDAGEKDSAPLLPGLGGLLDLVDSVLLAGPVAVLLWKVLPLATWTV